jgi:hypothetical protein
LALFDAAHPFCSPSRKLFKRDKGLAVTGKFVRALIDLGKFALEAENSAPI